MNSMKSWAPPTPETLERVAAQCARPEGRAYFFERLENPSWVKPLAEMGFFQDPPGPIPAEEPGYVRFPYWPEGAYLARMSALAPDDVAAVLSGASSSDNPRVTQALLQAATSLAPGQLRTLRSR